MQHDYGSEANAVFVMKYARRVTDERAELIADGIKCQRLPAIEAYVPAGRSRNATLSQASLAVSWSGWHRLARPEWTLRGQRRPRRSGR